MDKFVDEHVRQIETYTAAIVDRMLDTGEQLIRATDLLLHKQATTEAEMPYWQKIEIMAEAIDCTRESVEAWPISTALAGYIAVATPGRPAHTQSRAKRHNNWNRR